MSMQSGYVSFYRLHSKQSDLKDIFRFFMMKNNRLETKKKKLELERLLSVSNRDSYLNDELTTEFN